MINYDTGVFADKNQRFKRRKHKPLVQALAIWESPLHVFEVQKLARRTIFGPLV